MRKMSFWSKITMLLMVLVLVIPLLAACDDDDDDDDKTTQPAATTQPAESSDLPFVDDPVKIGAIQDWSGPTAMAGWIGDGAISFAEWYFNEKQGGIVVGDVRRPIEIAKYDNKGQIANANAATKKAVLEGCTAVVWGGVTNEMGFPVADITDPEKMLYSGFFNPEELFTDYKYATNSIFDQDERNELCARLAVEKLQAKTIGFLGYNFASNMDTIDAVEARLKALDPEIEVVYKEFYDAGLHDFSPLLTKLRRAAPDVVILSTTEENSSAMAMQMPSLGGWGDIAVIGWAEHTDFPGIEDNSGADGWYIPMMWMAGTGSPEARATGEAWAEKCAEDSGWCKKYSPLGSVPMATHLMMYNPIMTAVKAIELAGTDDRQKVAEAAVSGNLEYDSALGLLRITKEGKSNLSGFYVQMKDGQRVLIDIE